MEAFGHHEVKSYPPLVRAGLVLDSFDERGTTRNESQMIDEPVTTKETAMLAAFGAEFERLHAAACEVVRSTPADKLYWEPRASIGAVPVRSCGEHVVRSAGAVEQTFGGITANLWDDPFEWTLPETLATPEAVLAYLEEAADMRRRGLALLKTDDSLRKGVLLGSGDTEVIAVLLARTLTRAASEMGAAYATFRLFSDDHLSRL